MGHGLPRSSRYRSDRMVRGCPQAQPDSSPVLSPRGDARRHAGIRRRSFGQFPAGGPRDGQGSPLDASESSNGGEPSLRISLVPEVARLDLHDLPESHREGPAYLNVLRTLDLPQAVALAENGPGSSFTSRRRSMMISPCRRRRLLVSDPRQSAYAKACRGIDS